jgi:hypothetical protein
VADDPRRNTPDERALDVTKPPPAHDDHVAIFGVSQINDALVDLAFFADRLDEHPLGFCDLFDLGKRVVAGLPEAALMS